MSILTLLLLFFIAYLCFKAIGNIWNDAFKGIVSNHKQKKRSSRSRRLLLWDILIIPFEISCRM